MFKSSQFVMVVSSLLFSAFYNDLFWKKVARVYPFVSSNLWYFISLFIILSSMIYILLNLINFKWTLKPILILLIIITSLTSYFMNNFDVIINEYMMNNIFEVRSAQVINLLSFKLFLNLFFYGILPSIVLYFYEIDYNSCQKQMLYKIVGLFLASALIAVNIYSFSGFYKSFIRENKSLTHYANPTYYIYSFGKFIYDKQKTGENFEQHK